MNDTIGTISTLNDGNYAIMTDKGLVPMTAAVTSSTIINGGIGDRKSTRLNSSHT